MRESLYNVWIRDLDSWFVFNGISGAVAELTQEERDELQKFIEGEDEPDCPFDLFLDLVNRHFLVTEDIDEIEYLRGRYEQTRWNRSRLSFTIVTSLGCNFNCPYCFEAKYPSILTPDVEGQLLDVVRDQLPNLKSLNVTWFGGEPLLGKRPLFRLSDAFIALCDEQSVKYDASIVTNGYLMTADISRQLRDRRVRVAQVTLDGPPDVHNRYRSLASGRPTFWRILDNIKSAIGIIDIAVRVNITGDNIGSAVELLDILANEGLGGHIQVSPGHVVSLEGENGAPSESFHGSCLSIQSFADAERAFLAAARDRGLAPRRLPSPMGTPCTSVRSNEFVVGSKGELYKCWDSVGNPSQTIGLLSDYANPNNRIDKWLDYNPFSDPECRQCIALPVCMGGCADYGLSVTNHSDRCSTFRFHHEEQIADYIRESRRTGGAVPVSFSGTRRVASR